MGKRDEMKKKAQEAAQEVKEKDIRDEGISLEDEEETTKEDEKDLGLGIGFPDFEEEDDEERKKDNDGNPLELDPEEEVEKLQDIMGSDDDEEEEVEKMTNVTNRLAKMVPSKGLLFPEIKPAISMYPVSVEGLIKRLEEVYGEEFLIIADKNKAMLKMEENNTPEALAIELMNGFDVGGKLPFHIAVRLDYMEYSKVRNNPISIVRNERMTDRIKIQKKFGNILYSTEFAPGKEETVYVAEREQGTNSIILFLDAYKIISSMIDTSDVVDDIDDLTGYSLEVSVLQLHKKDLMKAEIQVTMTKNAYLQIEEA